MSWTDIASSLIGGWMESENTDKVNAAQAREAEKARLFNASQAALNRNFQAEQVQHAQNYNNYEINQARLWSQQMSDTSYQRAVGDLKSAGLNPMLAYSRGGATTPSLGAAGSVSPGSGSTASSPMPSMQKNQSAQVAIQSAQAAAGIRLTEAQAAKTRAEEGYVHAQTDATRASASESRQRTVKIVHEIPQIIRAIDKMESEIALNETRGKSLAITGKLQEAQEALVKIQQDLERQKITEAQARTRLYAVQSNLAELEVPGAENEAAKQRTWVGKAEPYVNSAQRVTGLISDIIGGVKAASGSVEQEYSRDHTIRTGKTEVETVRERTRRRR